MLKLLILLLFTLVFGERPRCDERTALIALRKPSYDFSIEILDRVSQDTYGHFVFSPISTWLQLLALAEGAQGKTQNEIIKVTKYHRRYCFRKLVREIFNSLHEEVSHMSNHRSIIAVDRLFEVKDSFKRRIETLNAAKVISLNFKDANQSANIVRKVFKTDKEDTVGVDAQDFDMTVLLISDQHYMKADWKRPFNPLDTKVEPFYFEEVKEGQVNMMNQIGYFNYTEVPFIDTQALELPFNDRITMILLLPNKGKANDLFWSLRNITLMTIFSSFKTNGPKLVNVKIPRWNQTTNVDNIPELISDMGVERVFHPHLANLRSMSDHRLFVSMMANVATIEVTEKGVVAKVVPESLIDRRDAIDFTLNRPFAYLIVDKSINVILFAGVYLKPSRF
ncbi:serine protease inhibitor 77Ba-like [Epargyreus clarus]|uniref:serine protease inhibitor 77Ba-like n=1 Tax=Epargyreus clarus TaxID=520877 RepID=UPI003C2EA87A